MSNSIGIFDSGYGGLTIFKAIKNTIPQYQYIYLGDNSRAPYGNKSFETVYSYTWQCVKWLIEKGCSLIILACNTASARALRSIQQRELLEYPHVRVLGVIRPTAEHLGQYTFSNEIGIVATEGTVKSETYKLEIKKFYPEIKVYQKACKLWVPAIEAGDIYNKDFHTIIKHDLKELISQSNKIDAILLGCTHYPIMYDVIRKYLPKYINIITQSEIVVERLLDYLHRHPEIEEQLSKNGNISIFTTDDPNEFDEKSSLFLGETIRSQKAKIS